ncbi:MAG: metallophosphoesterase [Oligoflexia bacterium]|nr:metallophosphoesterase [Oligoflexia bacterium]
MKRKSATLKALFLGLLWIAAPAWAEAPASITAEPPVVAVGDIHGDLSALVTILGGQGLIDAEGNWKGGSSQLVFVGDLNDRGPDTRYIMDYVMDLEKQAQAAGGKIQTLLGNHEVMVASGDVRYVAPEELKPFEGFQPMGVTSVALKRMRQAHRNSIANNEIAAKVSMHEEKCLEMRRKGLADCEPLRKSELEPRVIPDEEIKPYAGIGAAMIGNSPYAKWLRGRQAITKVGDTLFVHAGISEDFLKTNANELNKMVANWVKYHQGVGPRPKKHTSWVLEEQGPLWDRQLAMGKLPEETLDAVLKAYGAKRLVIGHTVQTRGIMLRYDGKVILIDTGNSAVYNGPLSALEIRGEQLRGKYFPRPDGPAALRDQLIARYNLEKTMTPALKSVPQLSPPCR